MSRWSRRAAGQVATAIGVSRFAQEIARAEGRAAIALARRLRLAGLVEVARQSYRESLFPALAEDAAVHATYSLHMDAVKPGGLA